MNKTQYPLNGLEMAILCPDAKMVKYTDLYNYTNVKELFGEYKKIVILYLIQNNASGHWTCLFKNKDGINFFDSYGVPMDYEFQILTPAKRQQLHEEQDYLQELLANVKVIFNNITYQKQGTATCGCFVAHRLYHSRLTNKEYFTGFVRSGKEPDILVSDWCFDKLQK